MVKSVATLTKKAPKTGPKKAPSAAQLKARANFAKMAKAGKLKKGSSVTRAKNKAPLDKKEAFAGRIPTLKIRPVTKPAGQGSDYLVRPRRKAPPPPKPKTHYNPMWDQAPVWM